MTVIQVSTLTFNSQTPNIQNFTTVRQDRHQGQGGGLLTLIHKSINFSRRPESPDTLADPHLEELTITAKLGNTELIITNVYIPPASSCIGGYNPSLDHLMTPIVRAGGVIWLNPFATVLFTVCPYMWYYAGVKSRFQHARVECESKRAYVF